MNQRSFSRRSFLKMGAASALGAMAGVSLASCSSGSDEKTFDPAIYKDTQRDAVKAGDVIHPLAGFSGRRPNIICILCDDMGYADLSCYGSKAIKTPNLDLLAAEGVRFTDFYSSNALCSPSRAGLLTGRYPHRTGVTFPIWPKNDSIMRRASRILAGLFADLGALDLPVGQSLNDGLPASEITIAEALKLSGYTTAAMGKWHLGDFTKQPEYLPRKHGFDYFVGFNASNDDWPVAFWRNETELLADIELAQERYTGLFTQEAVTFIERSKDQPFFLYLAHKDPHQPCFPSARFQGASQGGPHGDAVQEVDWGVGEIVKCLQRNNLDNDTLIVFTSDNGPWFNGNPGAHRGRKGQSYEGGFRVPMIAWWPGRIPAGTICDQPSMNIDFFPTFLALAGLENPKDRIIDGRDIWGLMNKDEKKSPHEALYFFHENELEGIRVGDWKYYRYINHYTHPIPNDKPGSLAGTIAGKAYTYTGRDSSGTTRTIPVLGSWPMLYNLRTDEGENYNVVSRHPDLARQIRSKMEAWEQAFYRNPRGWL